MTQLLQEYLPWILSLLTIYMTLLAGNNNPKAWLLGLANQVLWLTWIIVSEEWGFIPLTITLCIVYLRNHLKWNLVR